MAELQQLQQLERERRTTIKEKTEEITRLSQALKNEQQLRDKDIGRLTLSVNQLMLTRPDATLSGKKAAAQKNLTCCLSPKA